ncbi:hypothetical protein V499_04667 [Pseudogymnoascus sp. VKM F-103]|nr:hypothetical protein V499_04667 [Pseudogymnoascus sp. VKM F-103]
MQEMQERQRRQRRQMRQEETRDTGRKQDNPEHQSDEFWRCFYIREQCDEYQQNGFRMRTISGGDGVCVERGKEGKEVDCRPLPILSGPIPYLSRRRVQAQTVTSRRPAVEDIPRTPRSPSRADQVSPIPSGKTTQNEAKPNRIPTETMRIRSTSRAVQGPSDT